MSSFRFETFENVVTKHTLGKVSFTQAAQWAFLANLQKKDWTIQSVRMIDSDTVEVIKRRDANKSLMYKLGFD